MKDKPNPGGQILGFYLELDLDSSWMEKALCRKHPEIDFIPENGLPRGRAKGEERHKTVQERTEELVKEAHEICLQCEVRQECFDFGEATLSVGIWGGTWFHGHAGSRRKRIAY